MNKDQLISIHAFHEEYYLDSINASHEVTEFLTIKVSHLATVYLTIDHEQKCFTIAPRMPYVGPPDYERMRSGRWPEIDEIAILYQAIGADFARAIALQACTFRATLFAIETLALAKPTEIEAAKRLFTEEHDPSLTSHNSQLTS